MRPWRFLPILFLVVICLAAGGMTSIPVQEKSSRGSAGAVFQTLALETYMHRSFNYCNRMVGANGQPYFNIFWTEPAEAAHDWPDFGDVTSRQFWGVIMGRRMTGESEPIEAVWRRNLLNNI